MKIGIICFDFNEKNIRKQPWKYVYEIAKGLIHHGHDVFIITDGDNGKYSFDEIRIISVQKLFVPLIGEAREVLDLLEKENPDKVIMLLGLTSFLRVKFNIKQSVIGILTSPIYSPLEIIKNVGIYDFIKYRKYTFIHFINSLIPKILIKKWSERFDYIVVLSKKTKKRFIEKGVSYNKVIVIPPGIDGIFLNHTNKDVKSNIIPNDKPIIMYYTSPLTLRGTDTLVKSLPYILNKKDVNLLILSRPDDEEVLKEEEKLKKIAKKLNVSNKLIIISKYLPPNEVKDYVNSADILVLPFKIVLSDVPLSILEAMALGKVVISTDVDGIPELLEGRGVIVKPNDPKELGEAIVSILNDGKLKEKLSKNAKEFIRCWKKWNEACEEFLKLL